MKKYTLKRILTSLFTLLAILLVLFILMQLMPGSPFNDEKLTADMRAALYAKYGLDQPIYIQFFRYVGNMLRGDLGVSYNISKNTPISQLIQSRLPISIQIGGMAVTLGALVGLVLGIIAALKRDTIFDTIATIISVIGVSVPSYVFALALSYTFGFKLRWFPMLFSAKDVLGSSVLPSVSLSMFTMASIARFTRSEMIEVLDSDYMLLAESKGISGPALIFRHALRNALIPIITVLAPLIVDLMTGSLVVEKIFAIPGVGSLLVTAIQSNDYNVVIGLSFIYSAMYIGIMLVVDLLYGIIDPRIRLAKGTTDMAEKAIRLGGESTAAAITQAVQELYPEHKFTEAEFARKDNAAEIAVDTNFAAQSFWKDVRIRFFRKKSAVLGLVMIMIILLLAIFGPGMNAYTYSGQDLSQKNFAPRVPGIEQFGILDGSEKMSTTTGTKIVNNYVEKGKDDVYYWFGSDLYGRDIWTRTWEGARVSLIIAVAAAVIDMVIGMSYGLISGYFGGKVDMLMQRFLEVANGIPRLVIVTLLLLVLQPGMITIIFALMLTEWVGMSRIARAEMLKLKDQEFVLASRTLGAGSFFIIFKEVLPNIIGPIITQVMFSIPTAIFTEAFLSFVGLGIPVPQCSLGSLISELYNSFTTHPYQIIPPIVVMSLLMLSFNLLADGLREALDPKMKSM